MLSVQTITISILLLGAAPLLAGYGFCKKLELFQSFYGWYLTGCVLLWAGTEFLLVPMIYFKAAFSLSCYLILCLYIVAACFGLYMYRNVNRNHLNPYVRIVSRLKKTHRGEYFLLGITAIFTIAIASIYYYYQYQDLGDTHWIVSAVDMLKSDRLFLSANTTGQVLNKIPGIYSADLCSPWSFNYAFIAAFAGCSPLIAAHLLLPFPLLVVCSCVYLCFSDSFFYKYNNIRILFMGIILAVQLLGCYSINSSEAQLMTRIWQGPAVVACIGLPIMILQFLNTYSKPFSRKSWFFILLCGMALCFMDRSGVILALFLILAFSISYALVHKDMRIILYGIAISLPNIICWILADLVPYGIHFSGNPSAARVLRILQYNFNSYYGNGRMLVLAACCAIILAVISRIEMRKLLCPMLLIVALIFYPFLYEMALAGLSRWNVFWLFPEYIIIGLTLSKFIEKADGRKYKTVGIIFILILLLISGRSTYNYAGLTKTSNLEKIDPGHKEIYDYILARDTIPSCIMREDLLYEARQYHPDFILPYSLNKDGSISMIDMHYFSLPNLMEVPFLGTYRISRIAKDHDINYIIVDVRDHMRLRLMRSARFRLLTRIDNDLIYCRFTPAEYRLQKEILTQLNLKNRTDRIIRAVRKLDAEKLEEILSEPKDQAEDDKTTDGQDLPSEQNTEDTSENSLDENADDSMNQENDSSSEEEDTSTDSEEEDTSTDSEEDDTSTDSEEDDTSTNYEEDDTSTDYEESE